MKDTFIEIECLLQEFMGYLMDMERDALEFFGSVEELNMWKEKCCCNIEVVQYLIRKSG